MRTPQFRSLTENLASLYAYGDNEEFVEENSAEVIFDHILDVTGSREWEDVPIGEIHRAIDKWKEDNL